MLKKALLTAVLAAVPFCAAAAENDAAAQDVFALEQPAITIEGEARYSVVSNILREVHDRRHDRWDRDDRRWRDRDDWDDDDRWDDDRWERDDDDDDWDDRRERRRRWRDRDDDDDDRWDDDRYEDDDDDDWDDD